MGYQISDFLIRFNEQNNQIIWVVTKVDGTLPDEEQLSFVHKWLIRNIYRVTPN
jgi:hypothetical protein